MKFLVSITLLICTTWSFSQEEMTLEQYDERLRAAREREEIALPKIASLKKKIAALKEEINSIHASVRSVWREILDLVGATQDEYDEFITQIETLQSDIAGFESAYDNDFKGWELALKNAQSKVNEFKAQKMALIPRVERLLTQLDQALVDSQESLISAKAANVSSDISYSSDTFTVTPGISLWRIARNPDVFGDPNRWPELFEANRDKITNPDIILPGQSISIPR